MIHSMTTYEIHEEGNGRFATISARTPEAALNKAARQYPRRAVDYNGYTGSVTWRAFAPGDRYAAASMTLAVR